MNTERQIKVCPYQMVALVVKSKMDSSRILFTEFFKFMMYDISKWITQKNETTDYTDTTNSSI